MISIIGIMFIFGLTWLFGALTVDKASLAFQVLFVIFNSLQGFFIFLIFCVLGRDGREHWLEFLFCGRYKTSNLHQSSANCLADDKDAKNKHMYTNTTHLTTATTAHILVERCGETNSTEPSNDDIEEQNKTTDIDNSNNNRMPPSIIVTCVEEQEDCAEAEVANESEDSLEVSSNGDEQIEITVDSEDRDNDLEEDENSKSEQETELDCENEEHDRKGKSELVLELEARFNHYPVVTTEDSEISEVDCDNENT